MTQSGFRNLVFAWLAGCLIFPAYGQMTGNPLFTGWYADPEIRIFNQRYYIYPTYSAPYEQQTFFDAWSSADLTNWVKESHILDFANVSWSTNRAAWAPSAISRNDKYYFYFSAGDGAGIGVGVSSSPAGPFKDTLGKPLISGTHFGAEAIDANAFIDDDGQAYLYYGGWSHCVVVSLNPDMISHKGDFKEITPPGYVEGPFMFKRNGTYYFMWSEGNWTNSSYGVSYATAPSPTGPFTIQAKILESDPLVANGPGHHSVLNIPGTDDWYIIYHRRPLNEGDGNHRVTCIDTLRFNASGLIEKVVITNQGVHARPLVSSAFIPRMDGTMKPAIRLGHSIASRHLLVDAPEGIAWSLEFYSVDGKKIGNFSGKGHASVPLNRINSARKISVVRWRARDGKLVVSASF